MEFYQAFWLCFVLFLICGVVIPIILEEQEYVNFCNSQGAKYYSSYPVGPEFTCYSESNSLDKTFYYNNQNTYDVVINGVKAEKVNKDVE